MISPPHYWTRIPSFVYWVAWGDIMMHVGGYHECCGDVQYCGGTQITKDSPHSAKYSWYPPHASWYPPRYWVSPTALKVTPMVLMISLLVLNTPPYSRYSPHLSWYPSAVRNTQDIPHMHHDIPHMHHDIPHMHHDITHGTAHTLYRVVELWLLITLSNCSLHAENIQTLVYCTVLVSSGPYVKTAIWIFCRMDLTIG